MSAEENNYELVTQDVRYQIEQYKESVNQTVEYVRSLEIETRKDGENALAIACEAINLCDRIEETKKTIVEPSKRYIAEVNSLAKEFVTSLEQVKESVVEKVEQWKEKSHEDRPIETPAISMCERRDFSFEVEDWEKIPREFLTVDEARLKLAMKQGRRVIPGIHITNTCKTYLKRKIA